MESCLFKVQIKAIAKILVATIIVQLFLTYTCGSQLKDLDLPEEFKNMEIWVHNCQDPIKKLYYSANSQCVYCAENEPWTIPDQYPQCQECCSLPPIQK